MLTKAEYRELLNDVLFELRDIEASLVRRDAPSRFMQKVKELKKELEKLEKEQEKNEPKEPKEPE